MEVVSLIVPTLLICRKVFRHMFFIFAENSDYVGRSNVGITFFSSDVTGTNRCISISINEDSIVEYNETFNVILTENSDRLMVQSGRNNTQITIIEDNDCESLPIHVGISYCKMWSC